jgi:hypothetical protein
MRESDLRLKTGSLFAMSRSEGLGVPRRTCERDAPCVKMCYRLMVNSDAEALAVACSATPNADRADDALDGENTERA